MSSMALLLLLALTILPLFTSPTISSSISLAPHPNAPNAGFRATLKHIDSDKNLTKSEIFHRAIARSNKRMQTLTDAIHLSSSGIDITAPILPPPSIHEFFIEISIGTPPLRFSALLDTGSDWLWTQCQPCIKCFPQTTPIYDPKKSSSYLNATCGGKPCEYGHEIRYADGTYTNGFVAKETFTFGNNVSVPKVLFHCGVNNTAEGGAGTVGLGRAYFSIVQKFNETRFAYCLPSYGSNGTGFLSMGTLARVNNNSLPIITTPLLENPLSSRFYYVSLEGITVGNTFLPINQTQGTQGGDDDPRNMIVDSGNTVTTLEKSYFQQVAKAFINQTALTLGSASGKLEVCFVPPSSGNPKFPKLIFHFKGADDLVLPQKNYIIDYNGPLCLAMRFGTGRIPQSFGNYQQQNTFVLHDLDKKTMSFVPTQSCDNV